MNSNRNTIWIIVAIIVIVGILFFAFKTPKNSQLPPKGDTQGDTTNNNSNTPPPANQMITITSPKEGDTVDATNGFTVTGQAKGNWYFEATAPIAIYAKNGIKLTETYISAQGEWMTTNFVPFSGTISPFLTNGATEGYIEFSNSNPSDNEGFRRSLRVNVKFAIQETQTIKLYFGNTKMNPNAADCSKVYAITRTVSKTSSIATLSIRDLLKGPTNEEATLGYVSAFNNGNGEALKSLSVKNAVATADFSYLPSGGSCLVGEARAQIEQTLKQFSTVKSVKILLNGSESEALQP